MAFRKGFTLIELVVTMLVVGILTAIAVPSYTKSVESARAGEARSKLQAIGMANRMYYAKNNAYTSGTLSASHILVTNRMLPDDNWNGLEYLYYTCTDGSGSATCCAGNNAIACAKRRRGNYTGWGYQIKKNGECYNIGGAPECPSAPSSGCSGSGSTSSC